MPNYTIHTIYGVFLWNGGWSIGWFTQKTGLLLVINALIFCWENIFSFIFVVLFWQFWNVFGQWWVFLNLQINFFFVITNNVHPFTFFRTFRKVNFGVFYAFELILSKTEILQILSSWPGPNLVLPWTYYGQVPFLVKTLPDTMSTTFSGSFEYFEKNQIFEQSLILLCNWKEFLTISHLSINCHCYHVWVAKSFKLQKKIPGGEHPPHPPWQVR